MLVELPLVRCLAPQEASRVPLRVGFWVEGFGFGCRVRGSLSSRLVPVGFDSHNWDPAKAEHDSPTFRIPQPGMATPGSGHDEQQACEFQG